RGMVYASMFGAATAAGAYVAIPLPPVPITLQTLVLFVGAGLLGSRLGALSQVIYLLLGIMGLPVFAGGKAGLGVLFGPTGGYLIGFVAGAFVVGLLVEMRKGPGFPWYAFSMAGGTLVVYLLGVLQLSLVARLTLQKAFLVGALPFLAGDALKIVAGALLVSRMKGRIRI
ncbi:MAG: biotin transporter BioY, partial [Deltaproteobacteria bacterium]|nr:biotin transporter BioY [Deltaproteobacteria bacterium]